MDNKIIVKTVILLLVWYVIKFKTKKPTSI